MGNKTYIRLTLGITLLVFTSATGAKTEEKPSVQSREANQIDQNSEPNGDMKNTVRGLVTDKLGRPRGNVYIAPQPTNIWEGVRSDTQGRFSLENMQSEQKKWFACSEASQAMGLFTIPENYGGEPINIILNYNKVEAEGRVVDSDGQGLADRKVELVVKTNQGLTYRFPCYGKTDGYGNYSHGLIPCGLGLSIQARLADANQVEQKYVTKAVSLSDNQIFIPMPRLVIGRGQPPDTDDGKVPYGGRVVNEQGESIPQVEVRLHYRLRGSMGLWGKEVMTDEHGQWKRRLPKDLSNLRIGLLHPEYIKQSWQRPSSVELLNSTNVMAMKRGLQLRGIVKNQQGEPIENALIDTGGSGFRTAYGEVIENCTTPRTLADGSFRVGGLAAGSIDIVVSAVGYAPRFMSVEIEAGLEPIEVSLKCGETYVGQVVDIDGNPIEAVKIDVDEWRIGNKRKTITRITETDSQGFFRIENLPEEGKLGFDFGKRGSGFESFSKVMPEDISQIDQIVMYKTPVFTGKVIDAETEEPVTTFQVVNGVKSRSTDESPDWSRHYKKQVNSEDGVFSETWTGYAISYPFDGDCCLKIEAKGYLPEIAPPIKLGEKHEPFVIRLTKAEPWKGTVFEPMGNPAAKAEVGWVGPGKKAFIKDGKFDRTGFVRQAEVIVQTDENGQFELNPTREQGLIVVVHTTGYAHVKSSDFDNGSQIRLTPWARIEGTIVSSDEDSREFLVAVTPIMSSEDNKSQLISWQFDEVSISSRNFVIDYVPSIPLHVGQIVRWEHSSPAYLKPQPGETYQVRIGGNGRTVTGKIIHPIPERAKETGEAGMSNPRRLHAVAYRIEPVSKMPDEIENMSQDSFLWLWRDAENVYERSKTFEKRFIPTIKDDGNFRFENISPGKYEFVINYHAPLGENVSCGRGVLEAVAISKFSVDTDDTESVHLPDVKMSLLTYPEVGDPAPLFEAESFDGKTIRLDDFRGKVVLLDFWATWCRPCVDEMPKIQDIHNTFAADERFIMIGMSLDWELDKAKKFIEEKGLNWPQVCLGDMSKSIVVKQYEIGGIPSTILIGPDGKITAKNLVAEQLKLAIAKALGN
ncbi:MAG: redoxin domain-containing protein [Sedimentisphaerales bacterium]